MALQVALLYSVILAPTRRVTRDQLLEVAHAAGLRNARTALSTGNLMGETRRSGAALERALESEVQRVMGRAIPVFCRSQEQWLEALEQNPFPRESARNAAEVGARFMRKEPPPDVVERMAKAAGPGERFVAMGRTLWLASDGRLAEGPLLRAVGAPWAGQGTLRSVSAMRKIAAVF